MPEKQPERTFSGNPDQEREEGSCLCTTDILSVAREFWPDRPAIKFGQKTVTYEDLFENSTRLARGLSKIGVGRGDRVAILSGNCPEYIEAYFASALIGAEFVPLNFRSKPEQLIYMLNTVSAKALFYADRNKQDVQAVKEDVDRNLKYIPLDMPADQKLGEEVNFQDLISQEEKREINDPGSTSKEVTIVMFTSGTTSLPKAVEQQHECFTGSLSFPDDVEKHETVLVTTPFFHVAALQGVFLSIAEGRTMVLLSDVKPKSLLQALSSGIQRATLVPTQIEQIINSPVFSKYDLSELKQITYGGSAMPLNVILEAMKKMPKVAFTRAYGSTETGGTVAVLGPEAHKITGQETEAELQKKLYSLTYGVGKPIEGVKITILDDSGNEIAPRDNESSGELGRIAITTNRVMQGYLGRQKETRDVLSGNTFITSDLGWADKEGNIYLIGRADDMIIRGGEKIHPTEVEMALLNHPSIAEVGVIGVPDQEWGQVIAAAICLKPGCSATEEEIIALCRETLGSSKTPSKIVFRGELPRNPLGKLVRKDLKLLFISS